MIKNTKFYKTISQIKAIAHHHFGKSKYPVLRLVYYSLFKINQFIGYYVKLDDNLLVPDNDLAMYKIYTDINDLKRIREGKELPREFFYDQMHGISKFYLVVSGDEPVYIHWVYVKGDKNRFLVLDDGDAELNYNTTMPKYRGRGLMNHMIRYILLDLKSKGFKRAFGVVHADNIPALKNMSKCGFIEFTRLKTFGQFNNKINCISLNVGR